MFILDTDTLGLLWRGQTRVSERVKNTRSTVALAITVVTWIEVLKGRFANIFTAANSADLRQAIDRYVESHSRLEALHVIEFNDSAFEQFDRLRGIKKLNKAGRPDLLIACIVLARDATLVTRNTRDYVNVPGLKIENWTD